MSYTLIGKMKRAIRKPPSYIAKRLWIEACRQIERKEAPKRAEKFTGPQLLTVTNAQSIESLWQSLSEQPFLANVDIRPSTELKQHCPHDEERILQEAKLALEHQVDLLGSGLIKLGDAIDWHQDYKTSKGWAPQYCHDIEYNNLDQPSDVKFPWEISRMQWMIPLGQAYLLTQDDRYAKAVKSIIISWIKENPYAMSVNWSCTMDVALRIITWTWFFYVFNKAPSWQDNNYQTEFLRTLYLHGDFTSRHLEESDVNGNHYTSDAAGLVFAGLFFKHSETAQQWLNTGWNILTEEIRLQISMDGVDFEASLPYHRLVFELFLLTALYRQSHGLDVEEPYQNRLIKMAKYTAAYSRQDGSVPLVGDADDGRVLPFSMRPINEHRYLIGITALTFKQPDLLNLYSGPNTELYWLLGASACEELLSKCQQKIAYQSEYFKPGYYVMRNDKDHVFIDCAEVGMNGKGGHGHNDCLSFTAALDGETLIEDRGAYLYTADPHARNEFRSTASHNTPLVDDIEINRFISWDFLWNLKYDAKPEQIAWEHNEEKSYFIGSHQGYQKLKFPVEIKRRIELNHQLHQLTVEDVFNSTEKHKIIVPLHLAKAVNIVSLNNKKIIIEINKNYFLISSESKDDWGMSIKESSLSPSYGVKTKSKKLLWSACVACSNLIITIKPINKDEIKQYIPSTTTQS